MNRQPHADIIRRRARIGRLLQTGLEPIEIHRQLVAAGDQTPIYVVRSDCRIVKRTIAGFKPKKKRDDRPWWARYPW